MLNQDEREKLIETVKSILEKTGFSGDVRLVDGGIGSGEVTMVAIDSKTDSRMLIGKNGQNLDAFEHLVRLIAFRKIGRDQFANNNNFIIDIDDYRKTHSQSLLENVMRVADRVIATQRAEALSPMNAYERKLVHTELACFKELKTESVGEEPRRRVIIKPISILGEGL